MVIPKECKKALQFVLSLGVGTIGQIALVEWEEEEEDKTYKRQTCGFFRGWIVQVC